MREVITVAKAMLDGQSVTHHGEFVDVEDVKFDGPTDDDGHAYPVPVYIGAVRMGMCRPGRRDRRRGSCSTSSCPPSYNDQALEAVRQGAAKSGRSLADFEVPQLVAASANDDRSPGCHRRLQGVPHPVHRPAAPHHRVLRCRRGGHRQGQVDRALAGDQGRDPGGDGVRLERAGPRALPPAAPPPRCWTSSASGSITGAPRRSSPRWAATPSGPSTASPARPTSSAREHPDSRWQP